MLVFLVLLFVAVVWGDEYSMVMPRQKAPDFQAKAVFDDAFLDVKLSDYAAKGEWTVLLFYPFDYTFVCPTELISFSSKAEEFKSLKTNVLGISTDSHHTHLAWTRTKPEDGGVGKLNIPLVADTSKRISRSYGVLVEDESDDMFGAALRGLFLIDNNGIIRSIQINDDAVGRSVEEMLRLVQGFQYADSHEGEGCPANWTPGSDTIRTNADESKEYFRRAFGSD
jgi:alkyl hydroperoxide reductase subunit AhpC